MSEKRQDGLTPEEREALDNRLFRDWKQRQIKWMQSSNVYERAWAWITQEVARTRGFDASASLDAPLPYFAFCSFVQLTREMGVDPRKLLAKAVDCPARSALDLDAVSDSEETADIDCKNRSTGLSRRASKPEGSGLAE
jgi:hypothetical protein